MLQMTNAVVVLVSVRDGDLYNSETLGKIHRLTVGLLETKGVNPHAVVSLTHSRLNDIKIRDGMINILPVVRSPTQPQSPQELAQIKNAVYTNLGIRGVYVSEDDKTALIRAGFWDAEVNARDVFSRLRRLAAQERDANTEVAFAGNIVLAGWLGEAGPRVTLVLMLSVLVALLLAGVCGILPGVAHTLGGALIVSGLAVACAFGLLGLTGRSLEPLAWLLLFPLAVRGLCLVLGWTGRVTSEWQTSHAQPEAVVRTARALWRPCSLALIVDGLALGLLAWGSDVPAIQTFGLLGLGWLVGLLGVGVAGPASLVGRFSARPARFRRAAVDRPCDAAPARQRPDPGADPHGLHRARLFRLVGRRAAPGRAVDAGQSAFSGRPSLQPRLRAAQPRFRRCQSADRVAHAG